MLIFGTATVTLQKIIFLTRTVIKPGQEAIKFEKPWFQTESMFVGMFLCLVVYEVIRCTRSCKSKKETTENLIEKEDDSIQHWQHYIYVGAPAMCDMVATCLMNVGLVYLDPSIWQMLRGSMVVFSAILSLIFLKKKYYCYHWTGVTLVTIGLVVVAASSLMNTDVKPSEEPSAEPTENPKTKTLMVVMSIILVVLAQIIQASQIVIEEFLLKNVKAAPSLIVGLEGMWGGLVCGIVMFIIQRTTSKNVIVQKVFHEDTVESFQMIAHSGKLQVLLVFYVLCILFYNLFGMMVTQTYSAVYRTIMEAVRTMCIWIVNIIIFYVLGKNNPDNLGEKIDLHSLVELIGFTILLTGNFLFNRVLRLKIFYYEDQQPVVVADGEKKESV